MKWIACVMGLAAWWMLAVCPCSAAHFRLGRVIDGDTLEMVGNRGDRVYVDLAGIDAPEMPLRKSEKGQPFCRKARKLLANLVIGRQFSFQAVSKLVNRHVMAVVFVGEKNINLEILKAGYAEVYRGKLPQGFDIVPYRKEEAQARKGEKGMWSLGKVYISPYDWRKAGQKK